MSGWERPSILQHCNPQTLWRGKRHQPVQTPTDNLVFKYILFSLCLFGFFPRLNVNWTACLCLSVSLCMKDITALCKSIWACVTQFSHRFFCLTGRFLPLSVMPRTLRCLLLSSSEVKSESFAPQKGKLKHTPPPPPTFFFTALLRICLVFTVFTLSACVWVCVCACTCAETRSWPAFLMESVHQATGTCVWRWLPRNEGRDGAWWACLWMRRWKVYISNSLQRHQVSARYYCFDV